MSFAPQLFDISEVDAWKASLREEGYAVIKGILTRSERKEAGGLFRQDWNTVSPNFNFEDKNTWGIENTPMMWSKGMATFKGFGQSDFMWYLRTNSNIRGVFEQIHDTKELVTSLDGFSVYLSSKQQSKPWLHIDQNPSCPLNSVQGSYNFLPTGEQDAGFVAVPRSHIEHKPTVSHNKDWIMCEDWGCIRKAKKFLIPENCLTLWSSRLVHANEGMTKKEVEFNRLTAFLCFMPKSTRPATVLKERLNAYCQAQTTSHFANRCQVKKYPWGFGKTFEERGFRAIKPRFDSSGSIPKERLELI